MADTNRNIFSLSEYSDNTIAGEGISVDSVYVNPPYGTAFSYFAGGYVYDGGYTYYTIVDKLQFSSDSVARSPSADVDFNSYGRNPVASSTAAYWMSGKKDPNDFGPSSWTSKTSKTTFSTDTTAASTNYPSSPGLGWLEQGSTATETAGYIGGGNRTPGVVTTQLQKLTFATDVFSNAPRFPSVQLHTGDALGNQTHGYWSGGTQVPASTPSGSTGHGAHTRIARFTYASDTHSNVGTIPAPRKLVAASGNATEGYLYGGLDGHPAPANENVSTIIKITYATDTSSLNPSNLIEHPATGKRGSGNLSNGYVVGAGNPGTNSNVFKYDYSTGTQSNPGSLKSSFSSSGVANASSRSYGHPGKFSAERWKDSANSGSDVGYVTMGQGSPGGALRSSTEKLDMVTDTSLTTVPGGNVPFPGMQGGCSFGNNTDGITATGGNQPDMTTDYTYVNKFTYSTETFSSLSGYPGSQTAEGRGYAAGATGYYVGGFVNMSFPADLSSVNKFAFASDTWSESPSPLNDARYWFANIQNETEGWALGGYHPSKTNSEKITFSTDTWSSESSTLPGDAKTYYIGANGSGDATAGYWAGGHPSPGSHKVWKLEYATGTVSNALDLTPSSPADRWTLNSGMANETKGYFAGGSWSLGQSEVVKFPYATETGSNINPGMTQTRQGAFSFGPRKLGSRLNPPTATPTPTTVNVPNPSLSTEGYWSGGYGGAGQSGMRSITEKLTFATDTAARLPGSNCPSVKHWASGSSSATKGYSNGGYEGWESPRTSNIYSLTYASGTWATAATLGETRGKTASVNNLLYSWTGGGGNSDPATYTSKIDRLTFATETPSKNILQAANPFQWATGIGNNLAGYFCNPKIDSQSGTTIVEKITYSTDSIALTPGLHVSGSSSSGSRVLSTMAFGKGDVGYVFGGKSPNRTTVNKITFSTDTRSSSPGIPDLKNSGAGLASPTIGYFSGADPGTQGDSYKMPFSTESWASAPGANLSNSRQQITGFGAGMNGNAFPEVTPIL